MAQFSHTFTTPFSPVEVHEHVLTELVPALGKWGYSVETESASSVTFARRYRSIWVILVCIFLFPVGLLALLAPKQRQGIIISIGGSNGQTKVILAGEADKPLREQLEALPAADTVKLA